MDSVIGPKPKATKSHGKMTKAIDMQKDQI